MAHAWRADAGAHGRIQRNAAQTDLAASVAAKENVPPKAAEIVANDKPQKRDSQRAKRKNDAWEYKSSDALLASAMAAAAAAGTSGGSREALSQDGEADVRVRTVDSMAAQRHQRVLATPHKSPNRRPLQQLTPLINSGSSGAAALTGGSAAQASGGQRLSLGGVDDVEIAVNSPYKPPAADEPSAKRRPASVLIPKRTRFAETPTVISSVRGQCVVVDSDEPTAADDNDDDEATTREEALAPIERAPTSERGTACTDAEAEIERQAAALFVRCEPTDQLHSLVLPSRLECGMNAITPETAAALLDGHYARFYDRVLVLDCRFEYEYLGGHVRGALHVPTVQVLEELLQRFPPTSNGERVCVVLHCEFSQQRGPALYRALRNWDRSVHSECYPQLYYPELYLLKGGYKRFFNEMPRHCDPQAYQPMLDSAFKDEMGDGLRTIKINRRAKSAGDLSEYRALRRSLKW